MDSPGDMSAEATANAPSNHSSLSHSQEYPSAFEEFWAAYPRKSAKPVALQVWRQTKIDHPPDLMARVRRFSAHWKRRINREGEETIKYCPDPSNWLKGHRWEDDETARPPRPSISRILQQESGEHYADPLWRDYKELVLAGKVELGFSAWKEVKTVGPTHEADIDLPSSQPRKTSNFEYFLEQIDSVDPCQMNLDDFILLAAKFHHLNQRPDDSLARSREDYRGPLWTFCRCLQRHESLLSEEPSGAWKKVEEAINRISAGDPNDFWGQFGPPGLPLDSEDAESEFVVTWPEIIHPVGPDAVKRAAAAAEDNPVLSKALGLDSEMRYSRFLDIAFHLQLNCASRPIWLDQRRLGEALGCTQRQVSNLCKRGREHGIIKRVTMSDRGRRLSAEYWVDTSPVDPNLMDPENFYHDSHDYQDSQDVGKQQK